MLLSLSKRERMLLTLAAVTLLVSGFVILVHRPVSTGLAEALTQQAALKEVLVKERGRLSQVGDLAGRGAQVRRREERLEAMIPGRHAAALFVHYLSQAEQAAQVRIRGISAVEKRVQDGLVAIDIDLIADGSWLEQVHVLRELEQVPLLFQIGGWELIHPTVPEEQVSVLPFLERPELQGTYRISVFFRPTKPSSTDQLGYSTAGRDDPFEAFIGVLTTHFTDGQTVPDAEPAQLG